MNPFVYVGTYTKDPSKDPQDAQHRTEGIYVYRMDAQSGRLEQVHSVESGINPSFVAVHPNGRFLYAVNESGAGAVSSFALDPQTGALTSLNCQETGGADPCYLSFDPTGRWLLVANYSGGSLAVFPIEADGRLSPATDFIQHEGTGPTADRQDKAHAHCIRSAPGGKFYLACDLGMDLVWVYRLDEEYGRLKAHTPPGMQTHPGAGPRHIEFHPNGRVVYIDNELDGTITAADWDGETGILTERQTLPTLPEDFRGEFTVADLHLTPDGRFLYVSNRGPDTLAAYRVDPDSGDLTFIAHTSVQGNWPRNFAISPDGRFLLVANQYSQNIVVFAIHPQTGELTFTGNEVSVPRPVCVTFGEEQP